MNILQMSMSGAILILAIIVIRQLAIHRLPKKTFMIFWGVVLLRLLIPFSINLPVPVQPQPSAEAATDNVFVFEARDMPNSNFIPSILPDIPEIITPFFPVTTVWVLGMLAVALFVLATHLYSRKEYKASLPIPAPADNGYVNKWLDEHKGVRHIKARQSDRITAPLTYGVLKPVILFPKTTNWRDTVKLQYILTHELVHIKRFDILIKWLLAIALCVHWFNPLVWVMFILANRDIELSCDEAVVRTLGESTKSSYAMTLIKLEERRSVFAPLCTRFSKNLIEERIVSIMKIKKRSIVSIVLAVVLVSALVISALTVFASNPMHDEYVEPIASSEDDMPVPITDKEMLVIEESEGWDEWLEWFDSLTSEEQAYISVRPPAELLSPYRIATTLEEVRAIIALQDGTIPLTNVDVPEIRNRQADGVIILEQCLYEALDVLHQAYAQDGYPIRNLATTRIDMSPTFEEMPDYMRLPMIRHEIFRAAVDIGLVYVPPGTSWYSTDEESDRLRYEAGRLFALYNGEFPSHESLREAVRHVFGG